MMHRTILSIGALVLLAGCAAQQPVGPPPDITLQQPSQEAFEKPPVPASALGQPVVAPTNGLSITDIKRGSGPAAESGRSITVNYVGKLTNGTVFDSTVGKSPFTFLLGAGQVIKGWDQGVVGMKVGGKRKLVIPPTLGYGGSGVPPQIPPDATLVFEIELVSIN